MKTLYHCCTILALAFTCLQTVSAKALPFEPKDTVIINFGNNSKIMIFVKDKEDFESLQSFDINAMLRDLSITLDSTTEDYQVLKIEDSTGTRYLQDTTVTLNDDGPETKDERSYQSWVIVEDSLDDVTINIGRFRIKVKEREKTSVAIEKETTPRRTRHSFNIDLGMNNYLTDGGKFPDENDELYAVKPFGSWYVALSSLRKTNVGGPLILEWGGNINWYNFKFENETVRAVKEDGQLLFYEQEDVSGIKSKLTASYINLSFVPVLDFSSKGNASEHGSSYTGKGFRFGLGGYGGYRIGSKAKYVYKDGGREKDKDRDNFYLNNWRYGVRMQVGYRGLDLFVNYDLNDLFITNRGPQLNAFSFGITI